MLIDGGSVVNLITDGVARMIGAVYCQNTDLRIRTATGDIVPINYYVKIDVNIAGVVAHIHIYIIPMTTIYTLLLRRR